MREPLRCLREALTILPHMNDRSLAHAKEGWKASACLAGKVLCTYCTQQQSGPCGTAARLAGRTAWFEVFRLSCVKNQHVMQLFNTLSYLERSRKLTGLNMPETLRAVTGTVVEESCSQRGTVVSSRHDFACAVVYCVKCLDLLTSMLPL